MEGGYSNYVALSPQAEEIFNKVIKGLDGVERIPLAVSTQVVSGINYRFFCDSAPLVPNATRYNELMTVYSPLFGEPEIREIRRAEIV